MARASVMSPAGNRRGRLRARTSRNGLAMALSARLPDIGTNRDEPVTKLGHAMEFRRSAAAWDADSLGELPLSTGSRAVGFDMGAVRARFLGHGARRHDLNVHPLPDSAPSPPQMAVIDRLGRTDPGETPAPAGLQDAEEAGDAPPAVDARFARLLPWRMRLEVDHASSDIQDGSCMTPSATTKLLPGGISRMRQRCPPS